ncbi:MAG TPA: ABC transporter permease [Pyrinomonadaceae bacterium]|nr:ABC transporter permease [Pyrinomonadaceae bacterium]
MGKLWQDIRYGSRALLKARAFTAVAVLTLALGIGVNAALFTVFDAFVLKPLPLKDPDALVNLDGGTDAEGRRLRLFSYPDYLEYRDQNDVFSDLVAWNKVRATLGEAPPNQDDSSAFAEGYEYLFGQIVTGNYFNALGAEMILGRGLRPEDDRLTGEQPVVVLSHGCWKRRFDSDPQIVGKTIVLQGQPFSVIGVTAPEFVGTTPDTPSFWAPLMTRDYLIQAGGWGHKRWLTDRDTEVFTLLGRLKPGVTREQAEAATQVVTERLAQTYPAKGRKTTVKLGSSATFVTLDGEVLPLILPLLLGFGLVLLIACANVANLLLARAAGRQREIGVRLALGASRWRVVRQLVSESLMLALAGGAVGLLFAIWTLGVLYPIVLSSVPLPEGLADQFALNLTPDWRVFGFTLLIAAIAGIAAGLAPALQVSKPDLTAALKEEGSALHAKLSQSRLRSTLVVAQMAVCLSLLIGAGLLFKNMRHIQTVDTGMSTKNVFAVAVGMSRATSEKPDAARESELRHELADRLRATTGVVTVSEAYRQPLSGEMGNTPLLLPGDNADHPRESRFNFVSAEYFQTLSIPIVRGRAFTAQEEKAQAPFVVISEATAQRYWPGADPLGKRLGIAATAPATQGEAFAKDNDAAPTYHQYEVIGVARDVRSRWVWQNDESFIYVPSPPNSSAGQYLLVRTQNDPAGTMGLARALAATIHPSLRVSVRRTEENLAFQTAPFRAVAWLSGVLGVLALLLASIGLYGVMSFVVARRTREIGIRVALGAQPTDVVRMFLLQGLRLTAIGMILGIIGGALISRLLATVLIDLSPLDPVAFGSVSLFLGLIALLATYLPARRAARVDPLVALRYE